MGVRQLSEKSVSERIKDDEELLQILEKSKTNIKVVGAGGAGNNTITRLMQVGVVGAETVAVNTDAQDLLYTDAHKKVLIGKESTRGLGAGANPDIGMEAARENKNDIKKVLEGADMIFLTGGLGGGTGTGSLPIIADIAKKMGALTVAIVTLPFSMEGRQRMENAKKGFENLISTTDTLIVIPNDRLLEIVPDVSIATAFKVCDEILVNSVKGITELVTKPGLVNLDFADLRAVMQSGGLAMVGVGESDSENRAFEAVEKALNNPLLTVSVDGAKNALINVIGGPDITIKESQQIAETVSSRLSPDAKIIWGVQIDKSLGDSIKALVVATGLDSQVFGNKSKKKKDIESILGIEFMEE